MFKVNQIANSEFQPIRKDFYYFADGQPRFVQQNYNGISDSNFDRYFEFDFAGRMTKAFTAEQARTGAQDSELDEQRPYVQTRTYDVWGNETARDAMRWTDDLDLEFEFDVKKTGVTSAILRYLRSRSFRLGI
jgi:hypothetical protein